MGVSVMDEFLITNLRLLYKPLVLYYGEWELGASLKEISKEDKKGNMYEEFLNRYYYMPLNVIFKGDDIVNTFHVGISSRIGPNGRSLFFSKKAFLRNVVNNIDEVVDNNGDVAYKAIKKAIRIKKDIYRDVFNNGKESQYYNQIMNEYLKYGNDNTFEEFVTLCKKQYTRLLNGYNSVISLFDKPINIDKFISCFDINKLYLYTCYQILKYNIDFYNKYSNIDYSINFLNNYKKIVNDIRKKDSFYNTSIYVVKDKESVVYTIDDLFKDLDNFSNQIK